ncbi:MAG: malate/lactate/ureidoglycolate dehydrogenase, partial [Burkholderiales bacterium]|nr:malate/lactate/ureidoglycolate dehydrogenase [Burkholderiales bacterium]
VGMLPRYTDSFLEGGLKPNAHVKVLHDSGAMLRIDGSAGFGQVVAREATALGIERAREHGSCIVALGNAHHIGRIGAWAEQAADAGLVSIHFVNVISRGIVAPFGGSDARFGTNPFCAGVPLTGREPVILDFATSVIAQGKTRVAHNKGEPVAPDCLIDDHGRPTQDPRYTVVPPFGALLPFGGHKGAGLALMCELLGGALAAGMTQHRAWRAQRSRQGVPVDDTTWQEILAAATKLGVDPARINTEAGLG